MADAVVGPRAVVVHAQHAALAHPAVVAAGRLVLLAFLAEPRRTALSGAKGGYKEHAVRHVKDTTKHTKPHRRFILQGCCCGHARSVLRWQYDIST
jgi:hypothetical protein